MPKEYLDAAIAVGHVAMLPQEVKNLLALHSLQARWGALETQTVSSGMMGFRIYSQKEDLARSAKYVCVSRDANLTEWMFGVRRWEQLYGP